MTAHTPAHAFTRVAPAFDCPDCNDGGRFAASYCDCDAGQEAREVDLREVELDWIGRNERRDGDHDPIALDWFLTRLTDAEILERSAPVSPAASLHFPGADGSTLTRSRHAPKQEAAILKAEGDGEAGGVGHG